jgi:hypothetical protein
MLLRRLSPEHHPHEVTPEGNISGPRWVLLHRTLAVLVCVAIPAQSWIDGTGSRAWTMYARSSSYRLRIVTYDESGRARFMAPSELAARSSGDLASALGGAEGFRNGPQGFALRSRLLALAGFVCRLSHPDHVALSISIRGHAGDPAVVTTENRSCRRR